MILPPVAIHLKFPENVEELIAEFDRIDLEELRKTISKYGSSKLTESFRTASKFSMNFEELTGWYEMQGISLEQRTPRLKSLCQKRGEVSYPITLEGKVYLPTRNLVNILIPEELHAPQIYPLKIFTSDNENLFAEDSLNLRINGNCLGNPKLRLDGKYYFTKSDDGLSLKLEKTN